MQDRGRNGEGQAGGRRAETGTCTRVGRVQGTGTGTQASLTQSRQAPGQTNGHNAASEKWRGAEPPSVSATGDVIGPVPAAGGR